MLTTATVRELKPRDKMYEVTCAAMPGFVVRVLPTGKKVFLVRHETDGRWRREKIGLLSPTLGVDEARFDKTFGVNLRGPLFWCQAAWEQAMKDRPGVMINIASVGGLRAEGGLGVYNLTKAALIHLTRQLAGELGPTRVVGIAPGLVQTDFAAYLVENFGDRLAAQLPLQRLGDPQDIANLAVFLASDAASWITGETYVIDGGAGVRSTG